MTRINSRAKGASGEREFCQWLKESLILSFLPERNLEQVRSGGSDVINVEPFFFEVKRVENLDLFKAWSQVVNSARSNAQRKGTARNGTLIYETGGVLPVVAFRQNKADWEFLITAEVIGVESGYVRLTELCFKRWARPIRRQAEAMLDQGVDYHPARMIQASNRPILIEQD